MYPGFNNTTGGYPQPQQQVIAGKCPSGQHFLQAAPMPSRWMCDTCKTPHPQTEQSWGCRICNFDECLNCMNSKTSSASSSMGQQQVSTSSAIADITSCDEGHPFVFADLGTTTRWKCDFCGQIYMGGASYGCRPCNIDLCQACHDKQAAKQAAKKKQQEEAAAEERRKKEEEERKRREEEEARLKKRQEEEEERLRKEQEEKAKKQQAAANALLLAQQTANGGQLKLCPKGGHPLRKGTLPPTVQWKCDKCFQLQYGGGSWGCRVCDYDQCDKCTNPSAVTPSTSYPTATTTTHQEPPQTPGPSTTDVPCWSCSKPLGRCSLPNIVWKCDKCFKDHRGGVSYGCRDCNQDACDDCYQKLKMKASFNMTTSSITPSQPNNTSTSSHTTISHHHNNTTTTTTTTSYSYTSTSSSSGTGGSSSTGYTSTYKPPSHNLTHKLNYGLHSEDSNEFMPSSKPTPTSQLSQHVSTNPSNKPVCFALFVGINYPGTRAELRGCHNDVFIWQKMLHSLGFDISNRRVLIDDRMFRGRTGEPTKKEIMDSMKWLASCAKTHPHARLFFQYSGHGTQLPDDDGDEGVDGKDEALVPSDYQKVGCLRDDWIFDNLVKPLPKDAFLFSIQDCCHSSSVLDLEFTWKWEGEEKQFAPRRTHRTRDFHATTKKKADAVVVGISGCQDNQTSSDVSSTIDFHHKFGKSMPGTAGGAMSNSAAEAIAEAPKDSEGQPDFTYLEFFFRIQESLKRRKFTQVPGLTSTKHLDMNQKFSLLYPPKV